MAKKQIPTNVLAHWDDALDFTGDEIVALALGDDPSSPNYAASTGKPLYRRMESAYNAARRWHALDDAAPLHWDEIGVNSKEQLLQSLGIDQALRHFDRDESENLARWLVSDECSGFSIQRFTRTEITRWLSACGFKSVYRFASDGSAVEKSLHPTERATVLKIIIAMAIDGYGYQVADNKSPVPGELEKIIGGLGMSVTDDTIRKYLQEAKATVLPQMPHKS